MWVYYLLAVIVACYAFKCIALREGSLLVPGRYIRRALHLVGVHGAPVVLAGWSYMCGALFWALFPARRLPDASFPWFLTRTVACWCSFVLMILLLLAANHLRLGRP